MEIYNEHVRDMLSETKKKNLVVTEDPNKGIVIQNLKEIIVSNL